MELAVQLQVRHVPAAWAELWVCCEASVLKQSLYLPLGFYGSSLFFLFCFSSLLSFLSLKLILPLNSCCWVCWGGCAAPPPVTVIECCPPPMCSAQAVDGFSHLSNHAVCREQGDCKAPLVKHWAPYVSRLFFPKLYRLSDSTNEPFLLCSNNWEVVFLVCLFVFVWKKFTATLVQLWKLSRKFAYGKFAWFLTGYVWKLFII